MQLANMFEMGEAGIAAGREDQKRRALRDFLVPARAGDANAQAKLAKVGAFAEMTGAQDRAQKQQGDSRDEFGKVMSAFAQTGDPQLYARGVQLNASSGLGLNMKPTLDDDDDRQGAVKFATAIAQAYGGGSAANGVQSTYIDAQGNRVAILRNGSTQVLGQNAPNNQIIDTGNGFYGVNKSNLSAAPVQVGGQPQQAPQQRAPGEVPFSIDPSLPPEVQASIRANESQWANAPEGGNVQVAQGAPQGGVLTKAPDPLRLAADRRAEEASQRAEQANLRAYIAAQNAQRGNAPAGQRFDANGNLVDIPGARLPAGSGGTEDEKKAAGYAVRMEDGLDVIAQIEKRNKDANRPGWGQAAVDLLPDALGNALKSDDRQIIESAQLDALDAALTLATGAAYTKEQLRGLSKAYFPQPNDSEAAILDKQRRLAKVVETARIRAGRSAPSIDQLSPKRAPNVTTKAQYDALPSGAIYLEDGKQYRKP